MLSKNKENTSKLGTNILVTSETAIQWDQRARRNLVTLSLFVFFLRCSISSLFSLTGTPNIWLQR